MARLLQALKNLEAQVAWPAAGTGVLSHLSQAAKLAEPVLIRPPASQPPASQPPPPRIEPVPNTYLPRESTATSPAQQPPSRPATRPPTGAERAVRRTLGEPHRREPLADLAACLRQDASKTTSRTLLLVGIGPESATHETALHVACLLAEEGGHVLLVDGDLARRQLSADLDDLQEPGLSNLSREPADPGSLLRPTAIQGLAFLPAGTERFANLDESAGDLSRSLGQLAARFDLVLLDGGRMGDPGTAALTRLCDATYVVVRLGAVHASQAQQALRDLRTGGARVLGCIATGGEA